MSDSFLFVNDGAFRMSVLPQILDYLAKHGKRTESGAMNGQSIRSAVLSHRVSLGGNEYTVLELVCSKNGINPLMVDAKRVDGIAGFAVDKVRAYVAQAKPEWFPAPIVKSSKREVPAGLLESLGL